MEHFFCFNSHLALYYLHPHMRCAMATLLRQYALQKTRASRLHNPTDNKSKKAQPTTINVLKSDCDCIISTIATILLYFLNIHFLINCTFSSMVIGMKSRRKSVQLGTLGQLWTK